MSFLDSIKKAKSNYIDPEVSLKEELEKKDKEHKLLISDYANYIAECVKKTLIIEAEKTPPNTLFSYNGFIEIPLRACNSEGEKVHISSTIYSTNEESMVFRSGKREDRKDWAKLSKKGEPWSEIHVELSGNSDEILCAAGDILKTDGIMLKSYCAKFIDNNIYEVPFRILCAREKTGPAAYVCRYYGIIKSGNNAGLGYTDSIHDLYKFGICCSFYE